MMRKRSLETHECEERQGRLSPANHGRLLPQRVKNSPVVLDAEQLIWGCYPVRVGVLGIPKDGVRQPDQANHIADGKKERAKSAKQR